MSETDDRWPWEKDPVRYQESIEAVRAVSEQQAATENVVTPVCFLCGAESLHLTRMPFDSKYANDWVCPVCLYEAIGLLKAKRDTHD